MKKNNIQLRNYHLKRGRSNDNTPVYPVTTVDNVKGLEDYVPGGSSGVVVDPNYVHTDNNYTDTDKNKLASIDVEARGKSTYESYVDTTDDDPVMTEAEWVENLLPTVIANGDMAIVESEDYIDIFIYEPAISTSPTIIALNGEAEANKSATLVVTGSHLKADIVVSVPNGFYIGATGTATSATLTATSGAVSESVVIRHNGSNPDTDITGVVVTLTSGSLTKTVPLSYTRYAGPTIIADSTLIVKSAGSAILNVSGINLEGNITAAISGTDAAKFSVSGSPITQSGGTASGTLTVTFTPASGDTSAADVSATLTLSSNNATSVVVALTGKVSELTISKNSVSISTDQGVAATDTFTVLGVNLTEGVTITKTDSNGVFGVSPSSITKTNAEASAQTVTVTYQSLSAGSHSGSLAITSGNLSKSVTLAGTAALATTSDAEGKFTKLDANGNTLYLKRIIVDGQKTTDVEVHQGNYDSVWNGTVAETYSGNIVIPANVVVDGVTCTITKIATNAFRYNYNGAKLKSITLPNTITYIGLYFLRKATAVTSLVVPSSVETILGGFCADATSLASIDMQCATNPNFQTTWGSANNAWLGNTKITSIRIPDKVQTILNNEMRGCTSLASITFGTDLVEFTNLLGSGGAENVTEIICRGTTTIPVPNSTRLTTYDIKSTIYQNAVLKVPDGYLAQYEAKLDQAGFGTAIWSNFVNRTTYVLDINN